MIVTRVFVFVRTINYSLLLFFFLFYLLLPMVWAQRVTSRVQSVHSALVMQRKRAICLTFVITWRKRCASFPLDGTRCCRFISVRFWMDRSGLTWREALNRRPQLTAQSLAMRRFAALDRMDTGQRNKKLHLLLVRQRSSNTRTEQSTASTWCRSTSRRTSTREFWQLSRRPRFHHRHHRFFLHYFFSSSFPSCTFTFSAKVSYLYFLHTYCMHATSFYIFDLHPYIEQTMLIPRWCRSHCWYLFSPYQWVY